jgi:hypothetical protein
MVMDPNLAFAIFAFGVLALLGFGPLLIVNLVDFFWRKR